MTVWSWRSKWMSLNVMLIPNKRRSTNSRFKSSPPRWSLRLSRLNVNSKASVLPSKRVRRLLLYVTCLLFFSCSIVSLFPVFIIIIQHQQQQASIDELTCAKEELESTIASLESEGVQLKQTIDQLDRKVRSSMFTFLPLPFFFYSIGWIETKMSC